MSVFPSTPAQIWHNQSVPLCEKLREPEERPSARHPSRVVLLQGKFSKSIIKRIWAGFNFPNQLNS